MRHGANTPDDFYAGILALLRLPYSDQAELITNRIVRRVDHFLKHYGDIRHSDWTEQDAFLITYGDSLIDHTNTQPLKVLKAFMDDYLRGLISTIHILPYFPFSSDDGFSVIDYLEVNESLGNWQDITAISDDYRLMTDLVINHISRKSLWFADFVSGHQPGRDYFIEMEPGTDISTVTRPRSSPLLVPVQTRRGVRHVWATFSEDQIDLDFRHPDVLIAMIDILLFYLSKGSSVIRLDAIAFLWKELGTPCISLPETHAIVKLLRLIVDKVRPGAWLITETNVPHIENLSYFGDGDEAHMVYQFALPPLVLHALNRGTEKYLLRWTESLPDYSDHCTVLNFTASHDGVGLKPLNGLVPDNEVRELVDSMHRFGGYVSTYMHPDGTEKPYEINITLFDAMKGARRGEDQWQVERFLCSQIIMLGMRGIPALYIHSLLATPNNNEGVERTGRTRSINRRQWCVEDIQGALNNPMSASGTVLQSLQRILSIRQQEMCFHPDAKQEVLNVESGIFAFRRISCCGSRQLLALHNLTMNVKSIELDSVSGWYDLLTKQTIADVQLAPYQSFWLVKTEV